MALEPIPPAPDAGVPSSRFRIRAQSWALNVLAVLAVLYTLYYGKAFILPVVLAALLALLLSPMVTALRQLKVPSPLGAGLVVLALLTIIGGAASLLSEPAWEWLRQAPQIMRDLEDKFSPLRRTVAEVEQAASQVEKMAQPGAGEPPLVRLQERSLRDVVVGLLGSMAAGAVMMVFLLYFLLASGDVILRNLVTALPSWGNKRRTLEIAHHLQTEISTYLFTITLINAALAGVTSAALFLVGMPNPLLWGALAGLLNYVPYLGPAVMLAILTAVSSLSFDSLGQIALPPLVFFLITSLEGQLVTPTILGQRLALNPIMIFLGLIFWGWLWGVAGALLAVPIMVTVKIVCDHVPPLRPVGIVMGR